MLHLSAELHIVASFVSYDQLTYLSVLGYAVFIRARSCNDMGFPSFFNIAQFPYIHVTNYGA